MLILTPIYSDPSDNVFQTRCKRCYIDGASDAATTTLSRSGVPSISNNDYGSEMTATLATYKREKLKNMPEINDPQAKKSSEQLNHLWQIVNINESTIIIFSDDEDADYGLRCDKDAAFKFDQVRSLDSPPAYLRELECAEILAKHGYTFKKLQDIEGATKRKIDLLVYHRLDLDDMLKKGVSFEQMLTMPYSEFREKCHDTDGCKL